MYEWFSRRRSGSAFESKLRLGQIDQPSDQTLLCGEIAVFAVEFVILQGEKREFGALFVAIGRFLKINMSLVSDAMGGPMIRSTCAFFMPLAVWS